jgi:hypothetical protein
MLWKDKSNLGELNNIIKTVNNKLIFSFYEIVTENIFLYFLRVIWWCFELWILNYHNKCLTFSWWNKYGQNNRKYNIGCHVPSMYFSSLQWNICIYEVVSRIVLFYRSFKSCLRLLIEKNIDGTLSKKCLPFNIFFR